MATTQTQASINSGGFFNRAKGLGKSYLGSGIHQEGMRFLKGELGIGQEMRDFAKQSPRMAFAGRWLGRGFVGASIISGLAEEGLWGGVKGGLEHAAYTYGMGVAWGGIKSAFPAAALAGKAVGVGLLAGAVVGAAYYQKTGVAPWHVLARPYVRDHMRKHAKLEMGAPVYDQFGTLSTMRQRSVAAIQNSHINARSALGHEAMSMYRPYSAMGLRGGI